MNTENLLSLEDLIAIDEARADYNEDSEYTLGDE